jgi:hypothetical protein
MSKYKYNSTNLTVIKFRFENGLEAEASIMSRAMLCYNLPFSLLI